jgi:predicted DNA-binding protein
MPPTKSIRRSITMTPEMRDRLTQLVSKHPRDTTEADLIREALRAFLDEQEDLIGSRRHFQKSLQDRIDRLESGLVFQLNVLLFLLADVEDDPARVRRAIIHARQHGSTLLAQMKAVRDLKETR